MAIGAGTVAAAGLTYGVGSYRSYKAGIEVAARSAQALKVETRRVAFAIKEALGPELQRFACPAFTKAAILGSSRIAPHPPNAGDDRVAPAR